MSEEPAVPPAAVRGFKGLNNRVDPTALGLEWQIQADNLLCDDAGYLTRRPGLQTLSSGLRDLYGRRFTAMDGQDLCRSVQEIQRQARLPVRDCTFWSG